MDHDQLRHDPSFAAVIDKAGGAPAGESTLNWVEHATNIERDRHQKLDDDPTAVERLFVNLFLRRWRR